MRKLWGVLVVCMLASTALAESDADRLFNEGRALLAKNDPKGACEKFEAAIKVDPSATGTMLNLGLCYENLKKYATSIFWFRKAQVSAAENKLQEYEEAAKKYTVNIAPKVPTLKIEVAGPSDTEIRIDGNKINATDYGQVEVDPGTHEVTGHAAGKATISQSVDAKESVKLAVVSIALVRDAEEPTVDPGKSRKRLALLVGAGGLVLYGVTLAHGLYYGGVQDDFVNNMKGTQDDYDSADKQLKYVTTSFFVAGSVAVAAAVVLYFTAPGKEAAPAGTAFTPYVTGDQAGFAFSGSF